MAEKRRIKIELTEKEKALIHYESERGRNGSIKRQSRILYYANIGTESITEICQKTGYNYETIVQVLKLYQTMGINAIYQCKRGKWINHLEQISDELEAYFNSPPRELTKRCLTCLFHIVLCQFPLEIHTVFLRETAFARCEKSCFIQHFSSFRGGLMKIHHQMFRMQ